MNLRPADGASRRSVNERGRPEDCTQANPGPAIGPPASIRLRLRQAVVGWMVPWALCAAPAEPATPATPANTGNAQTENTRTENGRTVDWFQKPGLYEIHLAIPPAGLRSLRADHRAYVRATVTEGTRAFEVFEGVGIRVKGRTGSFRPIDDKPSLTLDFDRFTDGLRFHGYSKVHLNNSAEDDSYLHEKLGATLFRAAGVPAPRVCHAVVTLNGRRLGLYVVREGFEAEFLLRHFGGADGNLYEPEPGPSSDVDGPMRRSSGRGATDRGDLQALARAAAEPEPARRWQELNRTLDVEGFLTFIAAETLTGHRDGYGQARNNYRLYHSPSDGRFHFLPGGMDRLFGAADARLYPSFSGRIARAIVETPEGRARYRERLGTVFTNVFQTTSWTQHVNDWTADLIPALTRSEARALRRAAADLCGRIQARVAYLEHELARPEPGPPRFENGAARLAGWKPKDTPDRGRLEQVRIDGRNALAIVAGPRTSASWRTNVPLEPGRYRFEALARTSGVVRLPYGRNHGATLAVDGRTSGDTGSLTGDTGWTLLQARFDVSVRTAIELSCSLRAAGGKAWFDVDSLKLIRINAD